MKADFAKHFKGGALRNFKKTKSRKIRYSKNKISFTLNSTVDGVDLGRFRCTFSIKDLVEGFDFCYMKNLDYPYRSMPHPHIEDDYPCLGGFFIPMKDALESGEIDEVVRLSQLFLNSYGNDVFCPVNECAYEYLKCGCFNICECEHD